jgi:lipopolysaccharide transport system ATP-binding protein
MSKPVISVEGLGKRYTLHHQARSGLLRDQLASLLQNPFRRQRGAGNTQEEFWALSDVNFTVNQGDVLGIIGRNGAGKSTLLKILSRITEPTTGRITIQGRVASLLEVGTGFHGELSGRENIFLNGAILGMTRVEIRKKFDEIVAFSEVEKFLDTPVKHYSSGMYVRLAFAVAAHLEPEILIVDEVLAVGDAAFQKKCLGKMQDVSTKEGRTVLFVSHNLQAVEQLCPHSLQLESGRAIGMGDSPLIIADFIGRSSGKKNASIVRDLADGFRLTRLEFTPNPVSAGGPVEFIMTMQASRSCSIKDLHLYFQNSFGYRVAIVDLRTAAGAYACVGGQSITFSGRIAGLPLVPGNYNVGFTLSTPLTHVGYSDLLPLIITPTAPRNGLVPHAVQYLGTTLLDYQFSAALSPTSELS